MSTAKVTLNITAEAFGPTEHEFLLAAIKVYGHTLARIEAAACDRTPPPLELNGLIFTDQPFDGQQMGDRLIRELS